MHPYADIDCWTLGTTPLRFVRLIGMVVGVEEKEYDNNLRTSHYSESNLEAYFDSQLKTKHAVVDDGTRVIECCETIKKAGPSLRSKLSMVPIDEMIIKPSVYPVGTIIRVVGKVVTKPSPAESGFSRHLVPKSMDAIWDLNEECHHWEEVRMLHQTRYSQPFQIPALPPKSIQPPPETPVQKRVLVENNAASPILLLSPIPSCPSPVRGTNEQHVCGYSTAF